MVLDIGKTNRKRCKQNTYYDTLQKQTRAPPGRCARKPVAGGVILRDLSLQPRPHSSSKIVLLAALALTSTDDLRKTHYSAFMPKIIIVEFPLGSSRARHNKRDGFYFPELFDLVLFCGIERAV